MTPRKVKVLVHREPQDLGVVFCAGELIEVEAFADEIIGQAIEDGLFPGATFAFVLDGEVLLIKGYGVADIGTGAPVDPQKTLFSLGSIGKVFTTIAALQLLEQGRLDWDDDVNRYLKSFSVPATFSEPITIRRNCR